ncbi:MAG: hypothetical protein QFX32_04360 [Methanolinea sp.]|nr:hypothetical protein [Methanolinea sp.]
MSGCLERRPSEEGLKPQYIPETLDTFYPIDLNNAIYLMNGLIFENFSENNISLPIYYIRGRDFSDGKAAQWIIGTKIKNENYFVLIESNRQILIPYQGKFPERPITIDKIISPDSLIQKNIHIIQNKLGKDRKYFPITIELIDDTYCIMPSSIKDQNYIFYFNAYTGDVI